MESPGSRAPAPASGARCRWRSPPRATSSPRPPAMKSISFRWRRKLPRRRDASCLILRPMRTTPTDGRAGRADRGQARRYHRRSSMPYIISRPAAQRVLDAPNFTHVRGQIVRQSSIGLCPLADFACASAVQGHIAVVASVTSASGWPATAAYGASKAALNNLAESPRSDFDKLNIRIHVLNPGFVDTPLTGRTVFAMPALTPGAQIARWHGRLRRSEPADLDHFPAPLPMTPQVPAHLLKPLLRLRQHQPGDGPAQAPASRANKRGLRSSRGILVSGSAR